MATTGDRTLERPKKERVERAPVEEERVPAPWE
jgi:hypothetical protein